jgi:4-carboxymuconolactone decarboxylase
MPTHLTFVRAAGDEGSYRNAGAAAQGGISMNDHLPDIYRGFRHDYPEVAKAQDELAKSIAKAGPLDERSQRLAKLGIAVGALAEGAVRSNARKALELGISEQEIEQVALLAISTRGFPAAAAALEWVREVFPARP